MLIKINNNIN